MRKIPPSVGSLFLFDMEFLSRGREGRKTNKQANKKMSRYNTNNNYNTIIHDKYRQLNKVDNDWPS